MNTRDLFTSRPKGLRPLYGPSTLAVKLVAGVHYDRTPTAYQQAFMPAIAL
jgi:hypothetical protein